MVIPGRTGLTIASDTILQIRKPYFRSPNNRLYYGQLKPPRLNYHAVQLMGTGQIYTVNLPQNLERKCTIGQTNYLPNRIICRNEGRARLSGLPKKPSPE